MKSEAIVRNTSIGELSILLWMFFDRYECMLLWLFLEFARFYWIFI